ncbi:MCE family protein [Antrihabitans sp. YC3-6]|uniref:MCE family protein n=1 Tax=Antrihabitans stalagmiti TaxID=2799499 RepID=A0A934U1A7_9NOCA|nr:MCE family protein [Antrihabitans stalagmiti]
MERLLASRGLMSIFGVIVTGAIVVVAYFIVFDPAKRTQSYCALMPDAVGLYNGNQVTMLGVAVGTVTGIEPQGEAVRVDFDVDAVHPLRGNISATTVSDTIVANRNLAVIGDANASVDWDPNTCITHTLTPKSLTRTLNALSELADELNGSDDPAENARIANGITAFDNATAGTGPQINDLIHKLGRALSSPDAAIGHIGALVDALSSLSASVSTGWGDIKDMLTRFAVVLEQVNSEVLAPVAPIVDDLRAIIPWLNDVTTKFGGPILQVLDASVPLLHFIGANVGTIEEIIRMIPPVAGAFQRSTDPHSGKPALTYAPPSVAIAQSNANQVCSAVNVIAPGRCASSADGLADVQLVQFVLAVAGAR